MEHNCARWREPQGRASRREVQANGCSCGGLALGIGPRAALRRGRIGRQLDAAMANISRPISPCPVAEVEVLGEQPGGFVAQAGDESGQGREVQGYRRTGR